MGLASKSTGTLGRKAPGPGDASLDSRGPDSRGPDRAGLGPGIAPAGRRRRSPQRSGEGKPLRACEGKEDTPQGAARATPDRHQGSGLRDNHPIPGDHTMKTEKPIVLLVGDDPSYLGMLGYVLEAEGFSTLLPPSGTDPASPELVSEVDLVVLDARPQAADEGHLKQFERRSVSGDGPPVIYLTDQAPSPYKAAGADAGYATAEAFDYQSIIQSLRRAHDGQAQDRPSEHLTYADVAMDVSEHRVWRAGREVRLTPTEFRLLRYFLEHPDKVFSRKELADAVWQAKRRSSGRTVDVHVARLRKALGSETEQDLIRTVWTVGYALTDK